MSWLEAFWLGVVQGLTEFFPVSSSGHLVMLQTLLGVEPEGGLLFEVGVHVATLLAIVLYYRRRIGALIGGVLARRSEALVYTGKLLLGTLPAVIVGLTAKDWIERQFANPMVTGIDLLITACLLLTTRQTIRHASRSEPSWREALLIGCAQAFAILPGISRSGTTVVVALALGVAPAAAAEFSFLLGIIAIAGAAVLMLPEFSGASSELLGALAVGGLSALVSGVGAIWLFVRMLERQTFHLFAYYAFAVGAAFLLHLYAAS